MRRRRARRVSKALTDSADDPNAPVRVKLGEDGLNTYLVSKKSLFGEDAKDLFEVARQALIAHLWDATSPEADGDIAAAFKAKWASDNEVTRTSSRKVATRAGRS